MHNVSVIVPVYNAHLTIKKCIDSLLGQSYKDGCIEIICVDDGSTDDSLHIIQSTEHPNVIVISQANSGPARARNEGAKKAKGEILLFTDSDCELDPDWVSEMVLPFKNKVVAGVQGVYRTKQKEVIANYEQIGIERSYQRLKKQKTIDTVGTYSAGYRKSVFFEVGGFNEAYKAACGEDFELSYKVANRGYRIVLSEKAFCYHQHPSTFSRYFKVKFGRGYWRTLMYRNNVDKITKDSYTPPVDKVQLILVLFVGVFTPLALINNALTLALGLLVVCYLLSSLDFMLFAFRKNITVAILSPFISFARYVFFILGMSKGIYDSFTKKM